MALRAKLYFEIHLIFAISQSEIAKMRCISREYSAAEGGKNLFTQPLSKHNSARSAVKRLMGQRPFNEHFGYLAQGTSGIDAEDYRIFQVIVVN